MRFEVEFFEKPASGGEWNPVGIAEVTGGRAGQQAVEEVAEFTGWYRVRPEAEPDAPWAFYRVTIHGETGETIVEDSEVPPPF
ncbi:MAG TPA: hypothetical protein VHH72_09685 [Solirubrobacterales bacterium]|jgi:hypothetical protein|nr:hypothetical protein [Solirubrobacterales bacterium]